MIKPVCVAMLCFLSSASAIAADAPKESGFFFAYNDTDKVVTISVGNISPSKYEISPHSYRTVVVSTNNQNLHIVNVK
jgi:hypothetical protein